MKERIKNYLKQLQENDKKGFSLVELIIVMAIMAILVGVVASQVIPYMEKSRQSKDQQQLSNMCTTMVSAIAQDGDFDLSVEAASADIKVTLGSVNASTGKITGTNGVLATPTSQVIEDTFYELCGATDLKTAVETVGNKLKSKAVKKADKLVAILSKDGVVTIQLEKTDGTPASAKLTAESE